MGPVDGAVAISFIAACARAIRVAGGIGATRTSITEPTIANAAAMQRMESVDSSELFLLMTIL